MSSDYLLTKPKSPWRRTMTIILCALVGCYALMSWAVFLMQRHLLYFPTKVPLDMAEHIAAASGLHPWRNGAGQFIGWRLPASSASAGNVLIVHGNAGRAQYRDYLATPIHASAALDVYILEYPGYGAREGAPDKESFYAAADDALENLPANLPDYVVGESLGAGVAAHLAHKYPGRWREWSFSRRYDRLALVAQSHMPFFLAVLFVAGSFCPRRRPGELSRPGQICPRGRRRDLPPKFGQRLCD